MSYDKHNRDKGNVFDRESLKVGEEKLREIWAILEKLDIVSLKADVLKGKLDLFTAEFMALFASLTPEEIEAIIKVSNDINGNHDKTIDCGRITDIAEGDGTGSVIYSFLDLSDVVMRKGNNLDDVEDKQKALDNLTGGSITVTNP